MTSTSASGRTPTAATAAQALLIGPGLDPASGVPLYLQLEQRLLHQVESGRWSPGSQIPTEAELCEMYRVSRVTVREALALLVRRGLLSRGRGRGTFVRDAHLTVDARSVSSFSNELHQLGMKPGARLLGVGVALAPEDVADALHISTGTELIKIRRVRTADGNPIAVQTSLLLAARFPGLIELLTDDVSLYQVLRESYGLAPSEAREVFRVVGVPKDLAPLLDAPRGSHAFHVTRVTFDSRGAFEHTTSVIRGDRYEIRLTLRNP